MSGASLRWSRDRSGSVAAARTASSEREHAEDVRDDEHRPSADRDAVRDAHAIASATCSGVSHTRTESAGHLRREHSRVAQDRRRVAVGDDLAAARASPRASRRRRRAPRRGWRRHGDAAVCGVRPEEARQPVLGVRIDPAGGLVQSSSTGARAAAMRRRSRPAAVGPPRDRAGGGTRGRRCRARSGSRSGSSGSSRGRQAWIAPRRPPCPANRIDSGLLRAQTDVHAGLRRVAVDERRRRSAGARRRCSAAAWSSRRRCDPSARRSRRGRSRVDVAAKRRHARRASAEGRGPPPASPRRRAPPRRAASGSVRAASGASRTVSGTGSQPTRRPSCATGGPIAEPSDHLRPDRPSVPTRGRDPSATSTAPATRSKRCSATRTVTPWSWTSRCRARDRRRSAPCGSSWLVGSSSTEDLAARP